MPTVCLPRSNAASRRTRFTFFPFFPCHLCPVPYNTLRKKTGLTRDGDVSTRVGSFGCGDIEMGTAARKLSGESNRGLKHRWLSPVCPCNIPRVAARTNVLESQAEEETDEGQERQRFSAIPVLLSVTCSDGPEALTKGVVHVC